MTQVITEGCAGVENIDPGSVDVVNIAPGLPGVENVNPAPFYTESIGIGLKNTITPDRGSLTHLEESQDRILRRTLSRLFCLLGIIGSNAVLVLIIPDVNINAVNDAASAVGLGP
ncbi:UNVERIFIED_CONTAM: hypothetical protein K2H54_067853 [Gekko kuhli]